MRARPAKPRRRTRMPASAPRRPPSRVLPTPPAPVRVTSRDCGTAAHTCAIASLRPMIGERSAGRFPSAAAARNGGNSVLSSGATTCHTCSGSEKSRRMTRPRSTTVAPSAGASASSVPAALDTSTCPPWAAPMSRAHRLSERPNQSSPRRCAVPAWMATRTRSAGPSSQSADSRARCASIAASTASATDGNVAHNPSPVCLNSIPPWLARASRNSASWRSSDRTIPGLVAHARVEPSTSVNRRTTVSTAADSTVGRCDRARGA